MTKIEILRNEIEKVEDYGSPTENIVRSAIIELTEFYNNKNLGRVTVNFELPQNRVAYIYKYYELHAQVTRMALRLIKTAIDDPQIRNFFDDLQNKESVVVTSVGGGPGSDLEGFYRFWSNDTEFKKPNFILANLDLCDGWRECFEKFMKILELQSNNYNFLIADVLEQNDVVPVQLKNSDLVIMCRFLSAVFKTVGFRNNIMRMLRNMKSGAYLLVVDNMYRCWGCDTLDWMLQNIPQEEFSLIHSYGSANGLEITLDGDLNYEFTNYFPLFQFQQNCKEGALWQQRYPHGVGLQLWQRV